MNATRTKRTYPMAAKDLARFEEKYAISDNGCWEWQGALSPKGYGHFYYGKGHRAHRVSYAHFVGPLDPALEIDHLCSNRACVNPAHLEQVTHRENVLRSGNQIAINAVKTECLQGHPFDEANTYLEKRGGRICRKCRVRLNTERRVSGIRDACPYCPKSTVEGNLQRHIRRWHGEVPESEWPPITKVREPAALAGKEGDR